jgi:hypothetical protein
MKRLIVVVVAVLVLVPVSLWAQDAPKAEVFGGFSFLHISSEGDFKHTLPGWTANVAGNVHKNFGFVGDISGEYKTIEGVSMKVHSFLGGVQATHRMAKASVFARALYGVSHVGFSDSGSENDFTMAYGGGIDVRASDKISIRLIQFDWTPVKSEGNWEKNIVRFGFGIVFKAPSAR